MESHRNGSGHEHFDDVSKAPRAWRCDFALTPSVPAPVGNVDETSLRPRRPTTSSFKKGESLDTKQIGKPFDPSQTEISFAAFQSTDIGPVISENVSEGLLGQTAVPTDRCQIAAEDPLQFSLGHPVIVRDCYLTVYRLISSVAASRAALGNLADQRSGGSST